MRIYFAGPLFTPYERGYIDDCTALLRADGFDVFVPHAHELALGHDVTAETIFARDRVGIEGANAMLAILDGPAIDDGTACEIGMFHALMGSSVGPDGAIFAAVLVETGLADVATATVWRRPASGGA